MVEMKVIGLRMRLKVTSDSLSFPLHLTSTIRPLMSNNVIGPSLTGSGRHWQTQLVLSVNFLKQLNRPIRLEDLAITSGIEALLHNYELLEALKQHERVRYDSRTELFTYKASSHYSLV